MSGCSCLPNRLVQYITIRARARCTYRKREDVANIVDDRPTTGFASFFGKIVSQKTSVWYFLEYRYSYRFWGIWDWWYFPKYYVTDFNSPNSAPTKEHLRKSFIRRGITNSSYPLPVWGENSSSLSILGGITNHSLLLPVSANWAIC